MQFEKDSDPFGVDQLLSEVKTQMSAKGEGGKAGEKRYGIQEKDEGRDRKRARVDDDDE